MEVAADSQAEPGLVVVRMQVAAARMVVHQGATLLELAASQLERIALLVESVVVVEVLAPEHSHMWEQDREHMSKRQATNL